MSDIWHDIGCSRPAPEQHLGLRGDQLSSCPECGKYIVIARASGGIEGTTYLPPPMPAIPAAPQVFRMGWPTHKARRRLRSKRGKP